MDTPIITDNKHLLIQFSGCLLLPTAFKDMIIMLSFQCSIPLSFTFGWAVISPPIHSFRYPLKWLVCSRFLATDIQAQNELTLDGELSMLLPCVSIFSSITNPFNQSMNSTKTLLGQLPRQYEFPSKLLEMGVFI